MYYIIYQLFHMTSQRTTNNHQDLNRQALHCDPQWNSDSYLEKVKGRQDVKSSIATVLSVLRCTLFRAEYNVKLRKTNVCMKGIPQIANI